MSGETQDSGLVGQVVGGRYHVKRILGEGGMGIVYEAEQQMGTATRKVALKTLHAHLSHDPSVSARFHREVGTIAQLEHPNTIKVYDFGATADGTLYIAMEYVAGKSLSQILEESKVMPPERILRIVKQIAGSLEEAHQQGVIHRDLKPDNVVLTQRAGEKDVVKLLDFGIAARTESADAAREQKLTQQGMVLGTPPYMSPEQFTGKALDARSDIYSLGVMTYEMATGRLPFNADTPWQWATEHMMSQPTPFEAIPDAAQIPPSMRTAIMRALSKNKEDRQPSVTQFYEELAGGAVVGAVSAVAAVAPGAHTGTAAMAAPPLFDSPGPAKTAAMQSPMTSGPSTAQAVATAVPIPERRGGGNKGLIIGLAGVGGVLLIGMAIVGVRSMKSNTTDEAPPAQASPPVATVAPTPVDTTPVQTATAVPDQPVQPTQTEPVAHTTATTHATTTTPAAHTTTTTESKPPVTAAPKPPAGNACAACLAAASSGNFTAAASAYNSCSDSAQKSQCTGMIKSRAAGAVQTAAFNGNCAQAKAMAAAAQSMGVSAGAFAKALAACK
ncbi:MAG TPA: protein kinase [Polyangiaceae bacterium]|nr:protein kinase [Polyangiaceae bacterium]